MTEIEPETMIWKPCPTCWGQRRIIEGSSWVMCWTCLGLGDVQSSQIDDKKKAA